MNETQIRVVDQFGDDVKPNGKDIGEIIVKGNGVAQIAISNEQNKDLTSLDGWLRTGDMGTMDENGRIYVMHSKKDISITNVENVSSFELERCLHEHPSVQEAAVIATPHKEWGEIANAFIVLHDGQAASNQELIEFAKNKLSSEIQMKVTIMDELPRTSSGKILKIQLEKMV